MKYVKEFENHSAYEAAQSGLILPNVSLCVQENEMHYTPYVESPFFCKLTSSYSGPMEIEGSGELTDSMIYDVVDMKYEITSVEIGTLCTSIGDSVFSGCYELSSITISDTVTSIGDFVFSQCSSLTSVTIPSGVTRLGEDLFRECSGLTSITIPSGVTSVGSQCFLECSSLTSITSLAMTAPTLIDDTFNEIASNGTLYVPQGSSGYNTWMQNANYYLGLYNWTKVEQ